MVHTERLDALIPPTLPIHAIKIDVEGAEGPVLIGAVETIKRNQPYVILEHGSKSSDAFGYSSSQIWDVLTGRCGLALTPLADWLRGRGPLTKKAFITSREWYFLAYTPDQRQHGR